jgi:hypothetical protein
MHDRNSVASQRVKVRNNARKLLLSLKKLIIFSGVAVKNRIARPFHRSWGKVVSTHQRARLKSKSWARGYRDQRSRIKETTSSSLLKGVVTVLRGSEKGLQFCRRVPSAMDKVFATFQGAVRRYRRDLVKARRTNRMKVR